MIGHLSASQLQLYLTCSLKYRFTYIDGLPRPFKHSGLALGSAVHTSIEWMHRERLRGRDILLDELLETFEADWCAQRTDDIRFGDSETEERILKQGRDLLKLYYQTPHPSEVVGVEIRFRLPLVDLTNGHALSTSLRGSIDLVERDNTIVELKTGKRIIDRDRLDQDLQLTVYSYAQWMRFQRRPALRVDLLLRTKTPRLERFPAVRTKTDYLRLFHLAEKVEAGVNAGIFFPNPSWRCKGCEYSEVCMEWKG